MAICAKCGKKATLKCSRCDRRRYCSAACQKADWSTHKKACGIARHIDNMYVVMLDQKTGTKEEIAEKRFETAIQIHNDGIASGAMVVQIFPTFCSEEVEMFRAKLVNVGCKVLNIYNQPEDCEIAMSIDELMTSEFAIASPTSLTNLARLNCLRSFDIVLDTDMAKLQVYAFTQIVKTKLQTINITK